MIRQEQCNKVCRILDDVLASRPTERDSLIIAVRKAFESFEQFGNSEPLPSAQPDLSDYSDKLWRAAYERGKKEAQPEIIRCKDCKHKPYPSDNYDYNNGNRGFEIIFPDYRCPCRCDDEYYNRIPDDDWFCGNAERRIDE